MCVLRGEGGERGGKVPPSFMGILFEIILSTEITIYFSGVFLNTADFQHFNN